RSDCSRSNATSGPPSHCSLRIAHCRCACPSPFMSSLDVVMSPAATAAEVRAPSAVTPSSATSSQADAWHPSIDSDGDGDRKRCATGMHAWIRAIKTDEYRPPPTAYLPNATEEDNPMVQQLHQCQAKLHALRAVRDRLVFYPSMRDPETRKMQPSMKICTEMVLSRNLLRLDDTRAQQAHRQAVGLPLLGGQEALVFAFFDVEDMLRASVVCRFWRHVSRMDLLWEPLLRTSWEQYPIRELLGLSPQVPAIQTYMIYYLLHLRGLPCLRLRTNVRMERAEDDNCDEDHSLTIERAAINANERPLEMAEWAATLEQIGSLHLVCGIDVEKEECSATEQEQDVPLIARMTQQQQDEDPRRPPRRRNLGTRMRARSDLQSRNSQFNVEYGEWVELVDEHKRMRLNTWMAQLQRASEHHLRAFLRQMLGAVDALEKSNLVHAGISMGSIFVRNRGGGSSESASGELVETDETMTPLFQLHCRGHVVHSVTEIPETGSSPVLRFGVEGEELVQQMDLLWFDPSRVTEPDRRSSRHSMIKSLINCALSLWAHGRFSTNTSAPLFRVLILFRAHIPDNFRCFLEYAAFLVATGTATADKLLRHAFVAVDDEPDCVQGCSWSSAFSDAIAYQNATIAWYGQEPQPTAISTSSSTSGSTAPVPVHVLEIARLPRSRMIPTTQLGAHFLSAALDEHRLPLERFAAVVVPPLASSSWIQKLATSQRHTLQRLDLSGVDLPMSVLLPELMHLSRITHLRLPREVLRQENLENFIIAVACTNLLPQLRAMDEAVKTAMDRLEKVYQQQISIVSYAFNHHEQHHARLARGVAMAPKNKQREKQEQNKASSSARAHESLARSLGGAHATGFIGFSAFATTTTTTTTTAATPSAEPPATSAFYDGDDHEMATALKMLGKKGSVTKTKALQSLLHAILPPKKAVELRPMLSHFLYLYANEVRDQNDRKVRQMGNEVLRALTLKMKPKAFASQLRRLLPYWLLAMHDQTSEVAAIAVQAWETLFPDVEERMNVVEEHLGAVLSEFATFFARTPAQFDGIALSPDEQEERYERCVSGALLSISTLIQQFAATKRTAQLTSASEGADRDSIDAVVRSSHFARLVTMTSKNPNFTRDSVRKASYKVLAVLCEHAPAIITAQNEHFGKLILGALSDKSAGNHEEMWNAILRFCQQFGNVWESEAFRKFAQNAVWPRLYAQLRHGFYGSARTSFPAVLPLLSVVPLRAVVDVPTARCDVYTSVLEQIWKFLDSPDARGQESLVVRTQNECLASFFSIFLTSTANRAFLSDLANDLPVEAYVTQFEKTFKTSFTCVMSTTSAMGDSAAHMYLDKLAIMLSRLAAPSSDIAGTIRAQMCVSAKQWCSDVVLKSMRHASCSASRLEFFVHALQQQQPDNSKLDVSWLVTFQAIHAEVVSQLAMQVASKNVGGVSGLLEVCAGLYGAIGLASLLQDQSVEAYYQTQVRPAIALIGEAEVPDRKVLRTAMKIVRVILLQTLDKKAMLLEVFQDLDVRFGDLARATDVIQFGLQFAFSKAEQAAWLSSGSGSASQVDSSSAESLNNVGLTLRAIWSGKLLDEFLMISLRGRLDDMDEDAFSALLTACVGGADSAPVVSLDALLILAHFAVKPDTDSRMFVRLAQNLLDLLAKLGDVSVSKELASVQHELFLRLFQLRIDGAFVADADNLWKRKVTHQLRYWDGKSLHDFADEIAKEINSMLATSDSAKFKPKRVAIMTKKFLLLSAVGADLPTSLLLNKLSIVSPVAATAQVRKYHNERVLSCWGHLCGDDDGLKVVAEYFSAATSDVEGAAVASVNLLQHLLDLDVCHALTWLVLQQNWHGTVTSRIDVVKSFLTLGSLYEELAQTPMMSLILQRSLDQAKLNAVCDHRSYLFINQNAEQGIFEALPAQWNARVNKLSVGVAAAFVRTEDLDRLISEALKNESTWQSHSDSTDELTLEQVMVSFVSRSDCDSIENAHAIVEAAARKVAGSESLSEKAKYLPVLTASLGHSSEVNEDVGQLHMSILVSLTSIESEAKVDVAAWLAVTDYVQVFNQNVLQTEELKDAWAKCARAVMLHAIRGKAQASAVAALKIHRCVDDLTNLSDEQLPAVYPHDVIKCRTAFLSLLTAIAETCGVGSFFELAVHYREAMLFTALASLIDALRLKGYLVATYVALTSPVKSLEQIWLTFFVEAAITTTRRSIPVAVASVHDTNTLHKLLLEAGRGMGNLAAFFDGSLHALSSPTLIVLYALISSCNALRLKTMEGLSIDMNADDEDATEVALVDAILPKELRAALEASFGKEDDESTQRREKRRQKQKQARDDEESVVGRLLLWDLFLQLIPTGTSTHGTMVASALGAYVVREGLLTGYLTFCATLLSSETGRDGSRLKMSDGPLYTLDDLKTPLVGAGLAPAELFRLGARGFFQTVMRLPALVRTWYNDECTRSLRSWATKYFQEHITPYVLAVELDMIQKAPDTHADELDEMTVKGSKVSREITATYMQDDCALEMVIRVPPSYPLRSVEVECTKRIGISEDRWRRWVLQIVKVTASQDGSLLDAVLPWKKNVDKEFEGVEPCPICYSILNPKNMGLPNLPCKTCSNKYHNSCLYKWFNQSGKNKCPICQQPFC
ncbi:TPA: hypothetical protein N0F65_001157, partial [Lagenidium giganteum]